MVQGQSINFNVTGAEESPNGIPMTYRSAFLTSKAA